MKNLFQKALLTTLVFSGYASASSEIPATRLEGGLYAEVNSQALKAIIDSGVPVIIIDARPVVSKGDKRIPKSIPLRPTASPEQIARIIPTKNSLIVTYCNDLKCLEDADLATYLTSLGYKNVIEFSTGLQSWISQNYPVEEVK